ncbi:hypothetical protein QYF36_012630 [Acer negundo]|nr:hypothetical protein QYF36_012630 [Acer negundo]
MLSSSPSQSSTFPFFGVSALILIYVVILYLVIDFNCPAYGITTTSSSTTTEDLLSEGIDAGDFQAATMFFMHNVLILGWIVKQRQLVAHHPSVQQNSSMKT